MAVRWSDEVDEVLGGDQAVMLGYATPAKGVALLPVTNFAVRDRDNGTVTINSSIGVWRKLDKIRKDPHISIAFHTRAHGYSDRPEFVLVQGVATLSEPIENYPAHVGPNWERFDGPRPSGRLWDRWLRVYDTRVSIEVSAERVIAWPDLACKGEPEVFGTPLPAAPVAQRPPSGGTAPRVDHARVETRASALPDVLLGWVGADRFPMIVPVSVAGHRPGGIMVNAADGLIPSGGRRAGLTAHSFAKYVNGQQQRIHTGWLTADEPGGDAIYAPHTERGHNVPESNFLFHLGVGYATRKGLREQRSGR